MKPILKEDGTVALEFTAGEVTAIRRAWNTMEVASVHGRKGCTIGGDTFTADALLTLANNLQTIATAAGRQQATE